MAEGGVRITWAEGGNGTFLGFDLTGGDIPDLATEDFTMTMWVRLVGTIGTAGAGHYIMYMADDDGSGNWVQFYASDANGVSPFTFIAEQIDFATNPVIFNTGDVITAATNYFFALTWNHTTDTWTAYYVADGGTLTSGNSGAVSFNYSPNRIRVGSKQDNVGGGTDYTVRNIKAWIGNALDSTAIDAERHSEAPVATLGLVADYRLPNASTFTNTFSGGGAWPSIGTTIQGTGTITDGSMDPVDIRSSSTPSKKVTFGKLRIRHA